MQQLIANAPEDGKTPQAMAAIAPILLQVAQQLNHQEYYILQSISQNWQITTLQNRTQPERIKTVIYGYANLNDATQAGQDPNLIAQGLPAIDLLFQFISLPNLNSLILLERHAGETQSLEIHQSELKQLVQTQLEATFMSLPDSRAQDDVIHLA